MDLELIQFWSLMPAQPTKNTPFSISCNIKDMGAHYVFPNPLERFPSGSRVESWAPLAGWPSVGK